MANKHLPNVDPFGRLKPEDREWLADKLAEEAAELVAAAKNWTTQPDGTTNGEDNRRLLVGEYCDVVAVLVNMAEAYGLDETELERGMRECMEKNRRKGYVR